MPALLNPSKMTLVIEPVVAVITDQVNILCFKDKDVTVFGRAAGKDKVSDFCRVFNSIGDVLQIVFCTPKY